MRDIPYFPPNSDPTIIQLNVLVIAAVLLSLGFLIVMMIDIFYRQVTVGRLEAFFRSLAIFSFDFVATLLLTLAVGVIFLQIKGNADTTLLLLVSAALIGLFFVSIVSGALQGLARRRKDQAIRDFLTKYLKDKAHFDILSTLGTEFIEVEVYHSHQGEQQPGCVGLLFRITGVADLMSLFSDNSDRRELYVRLLKDLSLINEEDISGSELLVSPEKLAPIARLATALSLLTVVLFVISVALLLKAF